MLVKRRLKRDSRQEAELKIAESRVQFYFLRSHAMHSMEFKGIDDIRKTIEIQATLTLILQTRKLLSQDYEQQSLQSLVVEISTIRLLARNLMERVSAHELQRAQSSTHYINTDMQKLDNHIMLLQTAVEGYALPAVSIPSRASMPVGALSDSNGAGPAVDADKQIEHEVNFYSEFYPHLFHYNAGESKERVAALDSFSRNDDTETAGLTWTVPTTTLQTILDE